MPPLPYAALVLIAAAAVIPVAPVAAAPKERPMPLGDFNARVDTAQRQGEPWARSARSVATAFLGTECGCGRRTVVEQRSLGQGRTVIIVTDWGLQDDSLAALRHRVLLNASASGAWMIARVGESWSCRPSHGHDDFSIERCE